ALAQWNPREKAGKEIAFTPARVILQDFTGVPAIVDLAAMRDQLARMGGDPKRINPLEPVDLVIDHSVQVDYFGSRGALKKNMTLEFERNKERYQFLRWGQQAFQNFRVVPPGTGIIHQVNLEYLARVVMEKKIGKDILLYPDTLVGTDSHTTMINGLGVLGWGVGGIEAEAAMLGQPVSMLIPEVVGFMLSGKLAEGVTATDLVLTITEILRKQKVVGKFVEFFGPGLDVLSLPDRATIANMAPEYGATMGFCPVDRQTLDFLRLTGRGKAQTILVETYLRKQKLFRTPKQPDPEFSTVVELDLATVQACLAGPKRPQDRVPLTDAKKNFDRSLRTLLGDKAEMGMNARAQIRVDQKQFKIGHGAVVIASITSCTNTSNPSVMIGAGLLAKKAVEHGLKVKPWVKTSLAPGSKVVMDYLSEAGLIPAMEKLGFHLVGYGCATCIGNSGPLAQPIAQAIEEKKLVAVSVLSGNRNFEGRIHPVVRANYLTSPALVIAYALTGTMDIDWLKEPVGADSKGKPVYLRDIWPTDREIQKALNKIQAKMFRECYGNVFKGDAVWRSIKVPQGDTFVWDSDSTYVKNPPYFENMTESPLPIGDIKVARVLVRAGDSVTTDHISPAGNIPKESPAAEYLMAHGVRPNDFNSFGSRRGNHEVMLRGTFANVRLRNLLAPGTEGGVTKHLPDGTVMSIYEAAMKYREEKTPLIVLAGKEYGCGSSRDWAAKGPALLGIKAVIAESFERIHRSNLIGMGILPLQFEDGGSAQFIGLTGEEIFSIVGISEGLVPRRKLVCRAETTSGAKEFSVICRIDTPVELAYYQHGGILHYVLRQIVGQEK
ncbi:MAG: aconitate hydratase AcnA, partial [Candidatus Omnitrophica bacterium]|nr:aconitate hydratase AcnA [Candidatus Omnitrophota bacterium]